MNNKCIYYVEGPCEQQLIAALKEAPERLIPGKIKVFNVVQNLIPKSQMLSIQAGTTVVLVFDTDVSQNLHALQQTSAYGRAYSPSFGGGTCDVEFEALTGYSVSFLPSGSKPYQQHVTKPMFALPNYLKLKGYQTAAVHCFWAKYWQA